MNTWTKFHGNPFNSYLKHFTKRQKEMSAGHQGPRVYPLRNMNVQSVFKYFSLDRCVGPNRPDIHSSTDPLCADVGNKRVPGLDS